MKKISAVLALTAAMAFGAIANAQTQPDGQSQQAAANPNAGDFADVPAGHWAKEAVKLAAQCGIVVGFPDGTFRGNQPVTRYQAAAIVSRLLDALKNGDCAIGGGDGGDMTVIQNAIEELAADLAQLGVRVQDLEDNSVTQDDLARVEELAQQALDAAGTGSDGAGFDEGRMADLEATVESQADSIAALNDLVVLLNQDVLTLQDQLGAADDGGTADSIANLGDDLDALREFTTLMRRDQTALSDRVGDLEATVAALDTRVATLENNIFTVSGTISLGYRVSRTWYGSGAGKAPDFDIDRLGLNYFSSGTNGGGDVATDWADFGGALHPVLNTNLDAGGHNGFREGRVQPTASLTLSLKPRNLLTTTNGYGVGSINVGLALVDIANDDPPFNYTGTSVGALGFRFTGLSSAFTVGGAPLTINYGIKPGFAFTNYAFSNSGGRGDGFVANLSGAGILPFNPTLTAVYGSKSGELFGAATTPVLNTDYTVEQGARQARVTITVPARGTYALFNADGTEFDYVLDAGSQVVFVEGTLTGAISYKPSLSGSSGQGNNGDNLYFRGVKGSLSILPGFSGGVYYADQGPDITNVGAYTQNYGLDFKGNLFGLIDLEGEHNISAGNGNASYVKGGVKFGPFTIGGNYRYTQAGYVPIGSDANYVYGLNQTGFGVDLGVDKLFGFLSFAAYYDQRHAENTTKDLPNGPHGDTIKVANDDGTQFGISTTLGVLGLDLTPYYRASIETAVSSVDRRQYGVDAKGSPFGLNLAAGYNGQIENGPGSTLANNTSTIYGYVDTALNLAGVGIKPAAWFNMTTVSGGDNTTNFGGKIAADTGFLFGSALSLAAAYDTTGHSSPVFTASTIWAKAGLSFGKFFLPNSTFGVDFGYRADTNRDGWKFGPSFASPKGTWGTDVNGTSSTLMGLGFNFSYYDLMFRYGIFSLTTTGAATNPIWGQEFTIGLSLKF